MNENKLISVCIPFYNIAPYVKRCLDSVLQNTYTNLQVICVNDGSTDNTLELLQEYANKDSRVVLINKENGGLPSARAAALDKVTGDFIAVVDGDDWIHPQYFEILMEVQQRTNADVVVCTNKVCHDIEEDQLIDKDALSISCMGLENLMENRIARTRIWGRIYSKKVIAQHRPPLHISLGEDTIYNLMVMCSKENIKIASIDAPLYYYFQRDTSIVHTTPHKDMVYVSIWLLENAAQFSSGKGREIILRQALHNMYAYRYLEMFQLDQRTIKNTCRKLYKLCCKNWKSVCKCQ